MDDQRTRIAEDLTGLLRGDIHCDDLTVAMYASDASIYQIAPLGVAFPRGREDVALLARYSAEMDIPLVARGAGTGVAGQSLGAGLIVDFSRYMRRVETIGEETVRVQPGVVRNSLNRLLREHGRYFPPDPSNAAVTTIGSMIAVDAAGSRSVRVGSTRDHVQSVEMVVAGGHCLEFGDESLDILRTPPKAEVGSLLDVIQLDPRRDDAHVKRTIISRLVKLLSDHAEMIAERQPPLIRNCCGYSLRGCLDDRQLRMPRLLVGSEGTLGLFTAATLHTAPLPKHRGIVLLLFEQLEHAIVAVQAIAAQQPSACDLLDRRVLSLGREADPRFAKMISPAAEAALIVEQTGFSDRQARDRIRMVLDCVKEMRGAPRVAFDAYDYDEVEFLWSLPQRVVPLLTRLSGQTRPLPFIEDIAVPPDCLHDFLVRAQRVFQKHDVTASLYAHAAAGQLHLRPFLPLPTPEDAHRIQSIARDLYEVVFSVGGSISGEHGDGLSRTAFIRSQYGPLYRVFQQIKDVFDPHNLMNPGKIISDDPHVTMRNLRPSLPETEVVELHLNWQPGELRQAAALCNGCGNCKTHEPDERMCPFFRIEPSEAASPRSKANLIRSLGDGLLPADAAATDETKHVADLCFNCKQCQLECPSNVNIPHLMIEAKAAYVSAHGLSRTDWILSRAHSFGELGCAGAPAANWVLRNPVARWFLQRLVGIHRQRKLPPFARRTFLQSVSRELQRRPENPRKDRPVIYFVDYFANYHDPELARAFLAILKHHEIPVYVPPGQTASGMAMISAGDLDAARKLAETNLNELVELARDGMQIVCTEPAAALCLKYEYPMLLKHPDVQLLADQVVDAGTFLLGLHKAGRLKTDFAPLKFNVGYHTPCHQKALNAEIPYPQLLDLIPGLHVHRMEKGCSGMAGAYGLTEKNFRTSLKIGWGLISRMRAGDLDAGAAECSSCKLQMEQGTTTATLHPLKLMAMAYGIAPELAHALEPSNRKLVTT